MESENKSALHTLGKAALSVALVVGSLVLAAVLIVAWKRWAQ